MNLLGQKILVTGGSRGIGAAIVKVLAEAGAQVAFTYSSREDAAKEVLASLPQTQKHMMLKMDVSNEESVQAGIDQVISQFGNIDGLVNNAGITKDQLLLRMKTEEFDSVYQTNLRGTFLVTKAVLKGMLKARKGSIVSISSVVGHKGNPGQANYCATKAGMEAFSRATALEVASRGIRLNCVAPGFIGTDMTEQLGDDARKKIADGIPWARIGEPKEVADVVLFLLSDRSTYLTGQSIHVNGGLYMG
jgi:3-oxoacyl-[acyl-carrier protein] reductase